MTQSLYHKNVYIAINQTHLRFIYNVQELARLQTSPKNFITLCDFQLLNSNVAPLATKRLFVIAAKRKPLDANDPGGFLAQ